MTTTVVRCQLICKEKDFCNYQTLVFKSLEPNPPFGHKYIMCVVFPNWESYIPEIDDIGYLNYDSVEGGLDSYYDRKLDEIVKYNYTNLIFKKFIKEVDRYEKNKDVII